MSELIKYIKHKIYASRRKRFHSHLQELGIEHPHKPPSVTVTRWTSWLRDVSYYATYHLPHMASFFAKETSETTSNILDTH